MFGPAGFKKKKIYEFGHSFVDLTWSVLMSLVCSTFDAVLWLIRQLKLENRQTDINVHIHKVKKKREIIELSLLCSKLLITFVIGETLGCLLVDMRGI